MGARLNLHCTDPTKTALAQLLRAAADWIEESEQPVSIGLDIAFNEKKKVEK